MDWIVCFMDIAGSEILDYRKYVKDKTHGEISKIAEELEKELYEKDDMVDWYEIQEDIPSEPEVEEVPDNVREICLRLDLAS